MSYGILPPKTLEISIHNFTSGSDPQLPPSLVSIFNSLEPFQYLVRGTLDSVLHMSTEVYNPGTSAPEKYYDAYNIVAAKDWLANDSIGYSWLITNIYNVTDAVDPSLNTGSLVF